MIPIIAVFAKTKGHGCLALILIPATSHLKKLLCTFEHIFIHFLFDIYFAMFV